MTKIYLDTASIDEMESWIKAGVGVDGITTNPTLILKEITKNESEYAEGGYMGYVERVVSFLKESLPKGSVSFEITSPSKIKAMGEAFALRDVGKAHSYQVYVKVPFYTVDRVFNGYINNLDVIEELSLRDVPVNVTALMSISNIKESIRALSKFTPSIVSIFAGRLADAGHDPESTFGIISEFEELIAKEGACKTLWASVREPFNIDQAMRSRADIVTVPPAMLAKRVETVSAYGMDINAFELDTSTMFYNDAARAGISL